MLATYPQIVHNFNTIPNKSYIKKGILNKTNSNKR